MAPECPLWIANYFRVGRPMVFMPVAIGFDGYMAPELSPLGLLITLGWGALGFLCLSIFV